MRCASLVLAMTAAQRRQIEAAYPFSKGKVYRIAERAGIDVVDPYRKERAVFEKTLAQIEQGLEWWIDAMIRLTN
jgi:protein-tyrosine phosphatase